MAMFSESWPGVDRSHLTIVPRDVSQPASWDSRDRGGMMGAHEEGEPHASRRSGIGAYRALRDVAGEVLATRDLGRLLDRCGRLIEELLQADACSVALLDEPAQALVPLLTMASGRSTPPVPLPLDLLNGRIHAAIKGGRPLVVAYNSAIDGDSPFPLAEAQSALTAMLLPLPLGPDLPGILWVGRIHGEPFTPDDLDLAESLAALIALGMRGTKAFMKAMGERR